MEGDSTVPGTDASAHPALAELANPSEEVQAHITACTACQALAAQVGLALPKGLVSEAAFVWPAEPMAEGGMAAIYAAEDRRLGRTVILKTPRDGEQFAPSLTRMFAKRVATEAAVLAKLAHPSIVTIYELGKSTVGWPFCVLERVEGESLRARLDALTAVERREGRMHTRARLELLTSLLAIAEALAYAHERRVVHRDVTPNNIILGPRGEATLIDWGIARDLDTDAPSDAAVLGETPSASGRMVTISAGTPPYLSLEQSQGRAAAPGFDVYSFGVTLYETVAGRLPFAWQADASPAVRQRQLGEFLDWLASDAPVPPASARDAELSGIIARAMARDPAARFTADELIRALKQYLTGDLVFSHRYSLTGRVGAWVRKHRAATVGALAVAVALVVGVAGWAYVARQAREEAELRALAAAARADASEKSQAAAEAWREAELAKSRADEAQRAGQDAAAMRALAEQKRLAAEAMRTEAESAAAQAKGDANDAVARFREAMRQKAEAEASKVAAESARQLADTARAQAEKERDAAVAAQALADRERAAAVVGRQAADAARDAAKQAQANAEHERDSAQAARLAAEQAREQAVAAVAVAGQERNQAVAQRAAAERERDHQRAEAERLTLELAAAQRRVAELQARLRDVQPPPGPAPAPMPVPSP